MSDPSDRDGADERFRVVVNDEGQYSIWPASRENPPGWKDGGREGTREECVAYVDEVWTDMRPASLRRAMDEQERELDAEPV
jgi:MbtH protein